MIANDLLDSFLRESMRDNSLLAIYDDKNSVEKFYVGYVVEIFEDSILIYSYNENGKEDGYLLIRLVDSFKIEKKTIYLNNLTFLINQDNSINKKRSKKLKFKGDNKEGIAEVVSMCKDNKILLTIRLIYEDYITGYIVGEDDECYLMEAYTKEGMLNGYILIDYKDIQNLHWGGMEEINIIRLIN